MTLTYHIICPGCQSTITLSNELLGGETACPNCGHLTVVAMPVHDDAISPGREAYNIVSDIGVGLNVRRRDNLFQLAAIGVSLFLGLVIGAFVVQDHVLGALVGGFIGVLVGLLGSGTFLMVYRFIRHLLGDHR